MDKVTLRVKPIGYIGKTLDNLITPIMRFVIGVQGEAPQRTHRWNNTHLSLGKVDMLDRNLMVSHDGDKMASKLPTLPIILGMLSHLTRFGGWRRYLVIKPTENVEWHVGWRWDRGAGVSRVVARGPVRVLVGPGYCEWFGISAGDGRQLLVERIGEGVIGDGSEFRKIDLF